MLISMTGFGKAVAELENKKVSIEIKSLNSKQLDVSTRIPGRYSEKELLLRNEIKKQLIRGKVDFSIFIEDVGVDRETKINKPVVKDYFDQLAGVANELGIKTDHEPILQTIIRLPDSLKVEHQELDEKEWDSIYRNIQLAIENLKEFRNQEGIALQQDIISHIHKIEELQDQISKFEENRIETIKSKISNNLSEVLQGTEIDKNRFEQEIIYYLEKLDITEEKVRLANHCQYFLKTIEMETAVGKKLGFIAQEIGREINTIGSKANDSNIQKLVIQMKDELEKVKEQLLNVL